MKLLLYLVCFLGAVGVLAQNPKPDKMIRKDNTHIDARVIEITETQVKYRRFSNLDGPIYSINKSELAVIIYANGESELFENPGRPTPQSDQGSPTQPILTPATPDQAQPYTQATQAVAPTSSEAGAASVAPAAKEHGFFDYYEGGYCRFGDYNESIGGVYLGWAFGYRFNRAFSAEALLGYGTYFPDTPAGQIGITKLYNYYIMPKLTYRIHFSKESNAALFLSGGAGYLGTSGEFQDFTQRGSPTYSLDGYGGMGYEIGGGIKFGMFGISADYMGAESFGVIKLGLKLGI